MSEFSEKVDTLKETLQDLKDKLHEIRGYL